MSTRTHKVDLNLISKVPFLISNFQFGRKQGKEFNGGEDDDDDDEGGYGGYGGQKTKYSTNSTDFLNCCKLHDIQ